MTIALSRRHTLTGLGIGLVAPIAAQAQTTLPDKSVRIAVGYTAGSSTDLLAQIMAPELERRIGRHVSVDNRTTSTGAGASAGEFLKRSPADGSVIAFMPSISLAARLINTGISFDPEKDFTPLITAGRFQAAFAVSPRLGVSTLAEYAEWLKAGDPERRRVGISGPGTFLRVFAEMIGREIGVKLETVAGRGTTSMLADMRDGKIPAVVNIATSLLEQHRGGKLKILFTSGNKRLRAARNVPTVAELGYPNLEMDEWYGFFAPAGTPAPIVEEWNRQLAAVLAERTIAVELVQLGLEVETSTPDEASMRMASYLRSWKARLDTLGIKRVD